MHLFSDWIYLGLHFSTHSPSTTSKRREPQSLTQTSFSLSKTYPSIQDEHETINWVSSLHSKQNLIEQSMHC